MTNHLFDAIRTAIRQEAPLLFQPGRAIVSYADMLERSARFAAALVELGVRPGDRVAAQIEKSADALMLYLACVRAGAVYLPLNTAYTPAEIAYFIGDAEPRVFVCNLGAQALLSPVAAGLGVRLETLDGLGGGSLAECAGRQNDAFSDVDRTGDDLAAILYTSGTTGRSKGAMLTHENLLSNALTLREFWRFTADDRLIHALPMFHTHGLFVATNIVLLAGASMDFLPRFDADEVLSLMGGASAMMGVPTFYVRLAQHAGLTREVARKMRLFVSGSAPLLPETHRQFEAMTGHVILERYGMTETNMNTSNPYDGERIAGTVGPALPGVEVRIGDPETGRRLATGEIGVIEVKGPNVFKGYWRMPEKTAAEFREDGFFITGDLGKIDERGYVHIVGRSKDLVISGGYNIYPKEIEAEIDQLDGVMESAVIGVKHPDLGEGLTAIVVRRKGAAIDEASVLAALNGRLARFKQPKRIVFVDDLPRNAMGKVQKNLLREAWWNLYAA